MELAPGAAHRHHGPNSNERSLPSRQVGAQVKMEAKFEQVYHRFRFSPDILREFLPRGGTSMEQKRLPKDIGSPTEKEIAIACAVRAVATGVVLTYKQLPVFVRLLHIGFILQVGFCDRQQCAS